MSTIEMKKETVRLSHLHIAPRKVRRIADTIKKLPAVEAEAQLLMRPQRAAKPLLKLLRSGIANAKHNKNIASENLVISDVTVGSGPMMKRFMPRAMGRATMIQKKSSHITIVLAESPTTAKRFIIIPPVKKTKEASKKTAKPKLALEKKKTEKKSGLFGGIKRLFSRKTG